MHEPICSLHKIAQLMRTLACCSSLDGTLLGIALSRFDTRNGFYLALRLKYRKEDQPLFRGEMRNRIEKDSPFMIFMSFMVKASILPLVFLAA